MPELPEVEVTRLSFARRISGGRILAARLGKPLRWPLGEDSAILSGLHVIGVRRRGKYLLLDLSDEWLLLLHLGMSGSLLFAADLPPFGPHDHFDLITTHGTLRLHDPRRFGAAVLTRGEASDRAVKLLGRLGMEPLSEEFGVVEFRDGLKRRLSPIKQVLMAGDVVVGVGNIYASEALFKAGIRPTTAASRISSTRVERLRQAIRDVLACAVASGGSTLRDFSSADGSAGHFQLEAMVYGRDGQPCRHCGAPIRKLIQGQRSTYYCRVCQT
jgi:formamidopyrimidine-DNA glycosylase